MSIKLITNPNVILHVGEKQIPCVMNTIPNKLNEFEYAFPVPEIEYIYMKVTNVTGGCILHGITSERTMFIGIVTIDPLEGVVK